MTISELLELANKPYNSKHIEALATLLETDLPVYLLGRNEDTDVVAQHYQFVAIIDDFATLPITWHQHQVIRLEQVPKHAIIINGVTNSKPRYAQEMLLNKGYENSFYLCDFCYANKQTVPMLKFVTDSKADLISNTTKWQRLYNELSDQESKQTLSDILQYKLTGDPRVLSCYDYRPEQQYFEDFLPINNDVFVDGGGYQGETSIEFIKRYPDYNQVLFFEPDPDNIRQAKNNLSEYTNVRFFDVGLSDKEEELIFSVGEGSSASFVTSKGQNSQTIKVKPLDQLSDKVTFIKLDLEGWELNALKGALRLLQSHKPKLALGLYHSPEDMCTVFEWLEQQNLGYKYKLRHYTQSWYETVLYAY